MEARGYGIRVNAVSPGFLMTRMVEESLFDGDLSESRGMAMWKYFEARQGRSGRPEEVGDVVVLLCSPRMSLVVGQNVFIDG